MLLVQRAGLCLFCLRSCSSCSRSVLRCPKLLCPGPRHLSRRIGNARLRAMAFQVTRRVTCRVGSGRVLCQGEVVADSACLPADHKK